MLNSEVNHNELSTLNSIVNKIVFTSRDQSSQIIMFVLDLVWEPLCLVGEEMIVHDEQILNCFRE